MTAALGRSTQSIDSAAWPARPAVPLFPYSFLARLTLSLVLLASWLGATAPAFAASFTATVDRNTLSVGESLTLSLTFEDVNVNAQPALPPIPNFQASPGLSQRSEFSFNGTRQTLKRVYDYTLMAVAPGAVTIPPFQIPVQGSMLTSQPIQVTILPASDAARAQAAALTNYAFLRLIVPKTEVFLGEPFPVEIQLYWQNADEIRMPQLRADGFSTGAIPKPQQTRTQIGNTVYNLAIFRLTATPARTGNLTLGPAEESLTVLIPTGQRRQSFFGFGNDFQQRPTTLTSDAIPIRVLPLPSAGVPEDFNGAIGSYQLGVSASPTNVGVGDPITVKVQVTGRGPLDTLLYPAQTAWRDFTTYPATAKFESPDPLGLQGTKYFEQVIIPQNHEVKTLPPFRFTFFDPDARQYRTLTGPAIPLTVRPTTGTSTPPPVLTNASANAAGAPPVDDILHIRPRFELAAAAPAPLIFQGWFVGAQALPFAVWLALFVRRKRQESLASNPRLRRQREVAARLRDGMKEIHVHAAEGRPAEFFALLFRLLQEQLGERLDLPASAITEAVVDEKLRGRGLSDASAQSLHDLFQTCNAARYAPVQTRQELTALVPKLESILRDLQALRP